MLTQIKAIYLERLAGLQPKYKATGEKIVTAPVN
jgi:hypothetical protein